MKIEHEIDKAWQIYESHLSFRGVADRVGRNNYRLWKSLQRAFERGLREPLNLYLTDEDFEEYCACLRLSPTALRCGRVYFSADILLLPGPHPFSHFYGHDKKGALKGYALLDDAYFDPEIDNMVTEKLNTFTEPKPEPEPVSETEATSLAVIRKAS